jgi:hypothetical protein
MPESSLLVNTLNLKNKEVVFPIQVNFRNIKKVLLTILGRNREGIHKEELQKETGLSTGVLANTIPIMKELKLISSYRVKRGSIRLTREGEILAVHLKSDDKTAIKNEAKSLLNNSAVLSKAYSILRSYQDITPLELGKKLAEEFNKTWDTDFTYNAVGRSCIDILSGFYLVDRARYFRRDYSRREDKFIPFASANKILELLQKINSEINPSIDLKTPKEKEEFKSLIDLNLVEKADDGKFKLTESGVKLRKEIGNNGECKRIFREVILKHTPTIKIMEKLKNVEVINLWKVGDTIEEINEEKYAEITKKGYGSKFLSWLKKADVVEEIGRGKYCIKDDIFPSKQFTIEGTRQIEGVGEGSGELSFDKESTQIKSEEVLIKNNLKNSEFDIAITGDRKIFVKLERNIEDIKIIDIKDATSELREVEMNGKTIVKDNAIFIKLQNDK